ncbi:ABC transporter ATP-binding protein [Ligilactobacillus salivarius]|jgi:putative ABC transport system ATP-binding protein|uniref:ABC transporter ATP-binding protein n=1 Tax=Lactobacillus paragasseri TaxID=2107999 RepID=A0A6B2FZC4_9LACO|nr:MULTISPECIES: ABC transporter ATP-binding protein [Lactobacillaceae]MCH5381249.1 ABC transporter ATP-binding protein [Lactobacillus paragasseri]MYY32584.1 ABC transporter ATP-binding protein [Ligilactobacillus salivarius]MYY39004.1 ABC transporter ATP-binding protein [Ligilactobacillus salivarius]MYZ74301.1 ABC transporter ATP-binding protein [Ligilactobacillus salivarius]NDJ74392.1 ABC transporter ATP-binding protein [Lactobacillus paragasseri]
MIEFEKIDKEYHVGDQRVKALHNVSFHIKPGNLTIILGPSGSGKSTLLNILGGMDRPTHGKVRFDKSLVSDLNDHELTNYRRDKIGFVFQFYNLIPSLTALENVAIAAQLSGNGQHAKEYLQQVGLTKRLNNFPNQMSGGEMQRVSIARALSKKPKLLLCDEPTGALDSKTSMKIMKILQEISKSTETAVVMVTHNPKFEDYADRVIRLKDGQIERIYDNQNPAVVEED